MKKQVEDIKRERKLFETGRCETKSNDIYVPSIYLPKDGGAIKRINEKFSLNIINGTDYFSTPLHLSPARGVSHEATEFKKINLFNKYYIFN